MKRRAVFLDRDGVINALVLNAATGRLEAPLRTADARLLDGSAAAIKRLADAGYLLFVVSNQPNYAKGKSSLEELRLIHEKIAADLSTAGAGVDAFYYCYHHPSGNKPGYSLVCECRKPRPYFLLKAAKEYGLDLAESWLVGDRAGDMECGAAAGVRTIMLNNLQDGNGHGGTAPFAKAGDLREAAALILKTAAAAGEKQ